MNIKELVGKTDQVRYVTDSTAGKEFDFQPGQVSIIPAGVQMPPTLEANSEPFRGTAVPHTALRFDPDAYEKANQPRPEPARRSC